MRVIVLLTIASMCSTACSDPEHERIVKTTQPTYHKDTGRLLELTFDRNRNGTVDTWTEMDGSRMLRSRSDLDEDGTIDRWEYYDDRGGLMKVGFSRAHDGREDAWAFAGPDGRVVRIEISSFADPGRIDRWEYYEGGILLSADEDTSGDGRPDKTETYESGVITTVVVDDDGDGRLDRRLRYSNGTLTTIESERDESGAFRGSVNVK
jgi:hypothetical protein